MSMYKIIEATLEKEGRDGIKLLQEELEFQKHVASGDLLKGFDVKIKEGSNSIVMSVTNKMDYMWKVNGTPPDGRTGGVKPDILDLLAWVRHKEDRRELSFTSDVARMTFVSKVKTELANRYLTKGGEKVAPRRYFFIQITVERIKKSGAKKG